MNPLTVVLSGLLLAAAVSAGSSNNARRRNPYSSGSDSSEEYNRYPGPRSRSNFNRAAYGSVPLTFDGRDVWAQCPSVGVVPDQGCCDSSYALIPTAVMTDRTCIQTNSTSVVYSAFDAITCCKDCPIYPKDVCRGGDPVAVWNYWMTTGITNEECLPYEFARTCFGSQCQPRCAPGASGTVAGNKRKGLQYQRVSSNVMAIQQEIATYGPVEASFDMYLDFARFTGTGVYKNTGGPYMNKHSVKIIGWGTQGGEDYWLIVNTFGPSWGDGGIGKFWRGRDHMNIESNVRAARPNL